MPCIWAHTVRELCEVAFGHVELDYERFVRIDPQYFRPTEVEALQADPSRAQRDLGWKPQITFQALVEEMVEADLARHGLSLEEARERAANL
jgi:GDPmannose 4,6-dehydratase